MFPCIPPFSHSRVGEIVDHGSFDFVPERSLQRTITEVNEHALTVPGITSEKRAEHELVWRVEAIKRALASQKGPPNPAASLRRSNQPAPLRGKNINSGGGGL